MIWTFALTARLIHIMLSMCRTATEQLCNNVVQCSYACCEGTSGKKWGSLSDSQQKVQQGYIRSISDVVNLSRFSVTGCFNTQKISDCGDRVVKVVQWNGFNL